MKNLLPVVPARLGLLCGLWAALGGLSLTSQAHADTVVNYNFDYGNSLNVTLSYNKLINNSQTHVTLQTSAGPFQASWPGAPPAGFANSFDVYCVDLYNFAQSPTTVKTVALGGTTSMPGGFTAPENSPNNATNYWSRLQNAAYLYNSYASVATNATGNFNSNVTNRQRDSAALQLAIWNVIANTNTTNDPENLINYGDNTFVTAVTDRTSTHNTVLNDTVSLSNSYLDSLFTAQKNAVTFQQRTSTTLFQVTGKDSNGHQKGQYMIGASATPEASSLVLLSGGLLPLATLLKRRRHPHSQV